MASAARPSVDAGEITWVTTTRHESWKVQTPPRWAPLAGMPSVMLRPEQQRQRVDGFGVCFNELGWTALSRLSEADREEILNELFAPGVGAGFTLCRMPVGANDFSTDWYSYDEVDGDLELEHFSLEHDRATLVPFITAAKRHQPALRLWASPWSPPTWMKTNKHYAGARPWDGSSVDNGIRDDQLGAEGTDMMVQSPEYLAAYARYFGRFIEAYREEGIAIEMVMPQNEFNSAQVFPSCTWTPEGLARFVTHLGPEMDRLGVKVFLGTLERPDASMVLDVLRDPEAGRWIQGAGFQWAGKGAIAEVHRAAPELTLLQTEQECGDGRNDWRFCRYTWTLLRRFFESGANGYTYWNLALDQGGESRWGWTQNSLVVVDPETNTFEYTHEYHLLKHVAHFVEVGARRIEAFSWTGYENQLAFLNPDGSIVVVLQNDLTEELPLTLSLGDQALEIVLPGDSFSTIVVPAP